jgi:hypothetical protein
MGYPSVVVRDAHLRERGEVEEVMWSRMCALMRVGLWKN